MSKKERPEIPKEKIIQVNNSKKIDFKKPYTFIYFKWWAELYFIPVIFITFILAKLSGIYLGFRVKNRKNLKIIRKQGTIILSNHCHYYDTVLLNTVILPRWIHTAVAQRNCEVPYAGTLLRSLRCFPIPASKSWLDLINQPVGEALRRKRHILFLPEGELVMYSQTIHKFKPGAFILSYNHQAPILPMVYIIKRRKLFGKLLKKSMVKMTLVIGEPIFPPEKKEGEPVPRELLDEMADKAATWMENTIAEYHKDDK